MDIIQSPKRDLLSMSYMPGSRLSTEHEEWGRKSRPPGSGEERALSLHPLPGPWSVMQVLFSAEHFSESSAPGSQYQLLGSETIGPLSAVIIIFKSPLGKDRLLGKKYTN